MAITTLTQDAINWKDSNIIFDLVFCKKDSADFITDIELTEIDAFLVLEGIKEWTPDIKFFVFAHLIQNELNEDDLDVGWDNDGDAKVITNDQIKNAPMVTYEVYHEQMSSRVKKHFREYIFARATNYCYEYVTDYDQLSSEKKLYFIEQMQKNNLVWFERLDNLFKFWELQNQGLITKEEMNVSTNRTLLLFLIENCAKHSYSKRVALTWSHECVPASHFENYFLILDTFEGDYIEYSKLLSQRVKYALFCFIAFIEKADRLRVIHLFVKFPHIFDTFKKFSSLYEGIKKLTYKEIVHMKIYLQTNKDYAVRDRTKEDLEKLFKETYNRVPKVFNRIVSYCDARNIRSSDFIKAFDYKLLSKLLKNYHIYTALDFMTNKLSTNLIGLNEQVVQVLSRSSVNEETFIWLEKHKATQEDLLIKIINYNLISDSNMTLKTVKGILDMQEAKLLMKKVEEEYEHIGFKFANYKSAIINCTVEHKGVKAYMLKDERIALLGDLTSCCQKLGGAGESAMMYGLVASNAGFWACEKSNRIFAQAEIWVGNLNHELVLVFDNIELANDRSISDVEEVLRLWCKESRYPNIIMGRGYNELVESDKYIPVAGELHQPECKLIPDPYTDTNNGCVWLKKDGFVAF